MATMNDSEYSEAWNEMNEQPVKNSALSAELKQSKPKSEPGFMDKLNVVKDALLSSNKPRTNTMGGVR